MGWGDPVIASHIQLVRGEGGTAGAAPPLIARQLVCADPGHGGRADCARWPPRGAVEMPPAHTAGRYLLQVAFRWRGRRAGLTAARTP